MKITDVKIYPVTDPKLKAFATIVIDSCFLISDIKVISGEKGLFLSMPSKKRKDGTFKDIAHPINTDTRHMLEEAILNKYKEITSNTGDSQGPDDDYSSTQGHSPEIQE